MLAIIIRETILIALWKIDHNGQVCKQRRQLGDFCDCLGDTRQRITYGHSSGEVTEF